jgi:hypothetical protein
MGKQRLTTGDHADKLTGEPLPAADPGNGNKIELQSKGKEGFPIGDLGNTIMGLACTWLTHLFLDTPGLTTPGRSVPCASIFVAFLDQSW